MPRARVKEALGRNPVPPRSRRSGDTGTFSGRSSRGTPLPKSFHCSLWKRRVKTSAPCGHSRSGRPPRRLCPPPSRPHPGHRMSATCAGPEPRPQGHRKWDVGLRVQLQGEGCPWEGAEFPSTPAHPERTPLPRPVFGLVPPQAWPPASGSFVPSVWAERLLGKRRCRPCPGDGGTGGNDHSTSREPSPSVSPVHTAHVRRLPWQAWWEHGPSAGGPPWLCPPPSTAASAGDSGTGGGVPAPRRPAPHLHGKPRRLGLEQACEAEQLTRLLLWKHPPIYCQRRLRGLELLLSVLSVDAIHWGRLLAEAGEGLAQRPGAMHRPGVMGTESAEPADPGDQERRPPLPQGSGPPGPLLCLSHDG